MPSLTIAGHTLSIDGGSGRMTGGMLSLRISLRNAALVELARALAKLEGVRVTSGPAIVSRGDCYLVHCPGFKMVLSSPVPAGDFAQALLSRTVEPRPALTITCELGILFERLMSAPPPRADQGPSSGPQSGPLPIARPVWQGTSTLRRTALQPGKTLIRRTPLARKTPLGRGRRRP